jgi:tetratricopeptide (TPR) repeat protein
MNLDKLKESARKYEQREEWRRAIDVYLQAIREAEERGGEGTQDPGLYNRVGDLELKAGDSPAALRAYEQAAELYAEQGFFNNAIALCGKILRVNPSRTATYLRLAQLHARKNFVGEAKKNLLEYLERMNGVGQLEEAFAAVKFFADQFSGNPDIRLMLVELLRASSRTEEAKEQLEKLASELEARGDATGARLTRERLHEIDVEEPEPGHPRRTSNELVFLDTGLNVAPPPSPPRRTPEPPPPPVEVVGIAAEQLSAAPDNAPPDEGAGSLDADAAGANADVLGIEIQSSLVPGVEPEWGSSVTPVEGLDLITEDSAGPDESAASGDGLPMLDLDENTFALDELPETTPSAAWLVEEGAGESALEADTTDTLEGAEFDDVEAAVEPPPQAAAAEAVKRGNADFMVLQLSDAMAGAESAFGMEPGAVVLEQARRCLDAGDQGGGIAALEEALRLFETEARWDEAIQVCMDLIRLEPEVIDRYQKQVELAYRAGGRPVLVSAYLELADALVRCGAIGHAAQVYHRVLEHDPANEAAQSSLALLLPPPEAPAAPVVQAPVSAPTPAPPSVPAPAPAPAPTPAVASAHAPAPAPPPPPPPPPSPASPVRADRGPVAESAPSALPSAPPPPAGYVDLGALILDDQRARDTRMRVGQKHQIEDEDQAFHEALTEFKRGIEANLDAEDFQAHFDLGIAFKEMGLLDEAIAQFQKALRSPERRLETSEQLGAAFFEKGQFAISEAVLRRAVDGLPGADDEKIGLLYWLGRALEAQGRGSQALPLYERALAVDIRFLDLGQRVTRLGAEASR